MENDVSELNTQENDANNSNQPLFIKCENYEENLISFDSFSDSDKQIDEVVKLNLKGKHTVVLYVKQHLKIVTELQYTKEYIQLGGLKTHEQTHTNEKHYICEFCSKSFNQNSYLTKHLKTHKEDTRLPCPVCGKTYACLRLHLKCHSDVKTKNFCCEVCNKKFALKTTLNIHMRIHKGIKPYSCGICDKKFTQSTCLVRHMRIHTGETPYPCDFCDKRFSYTHHRLKHVKREHPNEIIA
ncbi:zf-H2C2 2 domain containing protein [Asbolus verrucosus]|uniref:Zf-H2C2 2 domain containing protein n=1 Tax=Asbolus verrucosus TaxID=1661398 RepID=A0A482V9V8_ASBVE|nr:zf-H2C2 2 domain containing protein [Asbolus verrucosus]